MSDCSNVVEGDCLQNQYLAERITSLNNRVKELELREMFITKRTEELLEKARRFIGQS